jgi:hypothetical protein
MANGLEIVLSDTSVRSVLVNVFGGITSCDAVAKGIVSAIGLLGERGEQVNHPIVVRLDGNNAAEGRRILDEAGLAVVEQVATMDDAARRAAQLAATGQSVDGHGVNGPGASGPGASGPGASGPGANGPVANGHGGDAPETGA